MKTDAQQARKTPLKGCALVVRMVEVGPVCVEHSHSDWPVRGVRIQDEQQQSVR